MMILIRVMVTPKVHKLMLLLLTAPCSVYSLYYRGYQGGVADTHQYSLDDIGTLGEDLSSKENDENIFRSKVTALTADFE